MTSVDKKEVALVTGAAQGLGKAIAMRLAEDGFVVAVNDVVDDGKLSSLSRRIGGLAVPADIAAPDAAELTVDKVCHQLGSLTAFIANAATMEMGPFLVQSRERWWHHIEVNLSGHFRLIQAAIVSMRRRGGGLIVIVSSGWGITGHPNATAYSASKAGLIALTKGLARELAPEGIIVNAIAPSFIDTEQLKVDAIDAGLSLEEMKERYRREVPIGMLASVDDIAAAVSFLVSPGSGAFVGQVLQPSGGVTRARA